MANISKIKRDRMLAFINQLKESNKDNDENVKALNEIANALNEKQYGLVWEEHRENVDEKLVDNIPIFVEDTNKKINNCNKNKYNFLIEGDNLHSLYLLEKTHKNMIDIIYIDPPYNTGEDDFTYNDNRVDKNDLFRHSKWISFMEKRLIVARKLLKKDGVIFISIGDDEVNNLGVLLNQIFDENNFIALLPRIGKKSGKTTTTLAKNHDYVFIYCKNKELIKFSKQENQRNESKLLKDEYFETRGLYRLNQCLDYDSLTYSKAMDYPLEIDGEIFYPGGSKESWIKRQNGEHGKFDWTWRWNPSLVKWGLEHDFIVIKNGKRKRIYTKTYTKVKIVNENNEYKLVEVDDEKNYSSLVFVDNEYSNDNAKKELDSFKIMKDFDFPKPSSLIKTCLRMANKKNAVVLDFFAGSGTTGQAVLELNKDDGGNRRFILCTNNENNICCDVTYPRLKTVITGKRDNDTKYSDGILCNLKYFKTDFVSRTDEFLKESLLEHINEMIELENGIEIDNKEYLVLLNDDEVDELENNWSNYNDVKTVYISSDCLLTESQKKMFKGIKMVEIPDYYFDFEIREAE